MQKSSQIFYTLICSITLLLNTLIISAQIELPSDLKNTNGLEGALFSMSVVDMKGGKLVNSYNSDLLLTPASSLKTLTALTALRLLDNDVCFKTKMEYEGKILLDGTLQGDLIIRGFGDPSFLSPEFYDDPNELLNQWKAALMEIGVSNIRGRLLVVDDYFEGFPVANGVVAEDTGNYYGGGSFSFNCFDNTYELEFNSNETPNAKFERYIGIDPSLVFTTNVNANFSYRDEAYIMGMPYGFQQHVKGSLPANREAFRIKGAYPDPARAFAQYFTNFINKEGPKLAGESSSARNHRSRFKPVEIVTNCSPTLIELLTHTLKTSNNLYADVILRHCGKALGGTGDLSKTGIQVKTYWKKEGLPTDGLELNDGSGLSRTNQISTRVHATILAQASESERTIILNGLKRQEAGDKMIYYKTGYMSGVKALSGYIRNKDDSWLAFSIIVERHSVSPVTLEALLLKVLMNS